MLYELVSVIMLSVNHYDENISWAHEAKYLGVHILSYVKFKCNFAKTKVKFYRSSNAILGQLGEQRNGTAAINLIAAISLPV